MDPQKSSSVVRDLNALAVPKKSELGARFFKTAEGQYGHGDVFINVTTPQLRSVAAEYRNLPLDELQKLLESPVYEVRSTALHILVLQAKRANAFKFKKIVEFYRSNYRYVNNWDLVDLSARAILGTYLLDRSRKELYNMAVSHNMWERRISIIATYAFIRENDFDDTFKISEMLLNDPEDLMHKAVGWMLREVGKRSPLVLKKFLSEHSHEMPRTALRYAIEKFPEPERKKYLRVKKK